MLNRVRRRLELTELLTKWRARLQPEEVGLPKTTRRHVPGLRREEVAELAGVSAKWYATFETGSDERRFSNGFVARVAQALRLDDRERSLLFRLALPEIRLAVEQFEQSTYDGALNSLSAVRTLVHRMSAVSSFVDAVVEASESIRRVLSPSAIAGAALVPHGQDPRIIGVGPRNNRGVRLDAAADACILVNYPNQFGHTTFSENRVAYRDTQKGVFDFGQRTAEGSSFRVIVAPSGGENISGSHPGASGVVQNTSILADDYWAANSKLETRSVLSHGLFSNGAFRGNLCAIWLEPRSMSPVDIELIRTVGAIVELAVTA